MSKTYQESEAERVLIQWAINRRIVYGSKGYASHSPEQSLAGGSGKDTVEREYTLQEGLCNREMLKVEKDDPVMFNVAVFEFTAKEPWLAKCSDNRGWREGITGRWHSVKRAYMSHFLEMIKHDYGIASSTYYNKLSRLKKRIWEVAC